MEVLYQLSYPGGFGSSEPYGTFATAPGVILDVGVTVRGCGRTLRREASMVKRLVRNFIAKTLGL